MCVEVEVADAVVDETAIVGRYPEKTLQLFTIYSFIVTYSVRLTHHRIKPDAHVFYLVKHNK